MKKQLLSLLLINALAVSSNAQTIIDTVSIGAGYANQKWYSLQNDEQGSTQSKDNWDIAFEITGFSASILANDQKTNLVVYKAPYSVANYNTIDTAGINSWKKLYNSDTTWEVGAFNKGGVFANPFYLGWGTYDVSTHIITGDSCYVIKLSATSFKKIKIDNLSGGIYSFSYANIDGSSPQSQTINKTSYPGKNFAYFDLTNNTAIDREPVSANWDLTFVKYTTFIPIAYGVTGVLNNKGVTVAQADNVTSPETYSNWSDHSQTTAINTIGYDWKYFDLGTSTWKLSTDTVYFVKSKPGDIWKLRFTDFGGSTNGNFRLEKERLSLVSINELNGNKIATLSVYPNPLTQDAVNVIFDLEKQVEKTLLKVFDATGQEVYTENLNATQGLYSHTLNTNIFSAGIYFLSLYVDGNVVTQKLIKQ